MTELLLLDDVTVELVDSFGDEPSIVRAARVSVTGKQEDNKYPFWGHDTIETIAAYEEQQKKDAGLINYLVREKHGSPFEHNSMTFYIAAPIFVFREFHRHRVGWSYNEMSGRYTKLPSQFYIPNKERPLVNIGTSSKPEFAAGTDEQYEMLYNELMDAYEEDWARYNRLLDAGIANEVARAVLPVGIFSQMYATANARSIMNFLSLRTKDERATHYSRPQHEIELVARKIEALFAEHYPVTYEAYNKNGRVAP